MVAGSNSQVSVRDKSPLELVSDRLEQSLSSLHDAIATLRTRLEQVLKPDGAGGANPKNIESPFPIGQFIERGANRVDSMRDELVDILDRLCI